MTNKIIIGSRGSQLSLAYASFVKKKILSRGENKKLQIQIKTIKTTGDRFP